MPGIVPVNLKHGIKWFSSTSPAPTAQAKTEDFVVKELARSVVNLSSAAKGSVPDAGQVMKSVWVAYYVSSHGLLEPMEQLR